jgi:HlyD family secretion protein
MKKKIALIAVAVVVVAAVLGLTVFKKKNGAVKYRKEALAKGDIESVVVTSGTLNPVRTVDVGSQVSGKIDKIYVDFNTQVKQGEVLAELDQSILRTKIDQNNASYLSALASLERSKVTSENLKKIHERSKALFAKDLVSFEDNEAAEASYLEAKADVQSAQAKVAQSKSTLDSSRVDLGYATIKSPIDGVVISRKVEVGQTVAAGYVTPTLFQIANDLTKMQVECAVDEADIGSVKESQNVRFSVDSYPEETFAGTVKQVRYSPTTTSNVVTYTTIVDVANPDLKLRPGMTATVTIIVAEARDVLRVPNGALRFTPPLPAEEIQKIMKEAGEKMMAQRRQEGVQPPPGPAAGMPGPNGGAAVPNGKGMRNGQPSKVWIQDEQGKLHVVFLKPGIANTAYTEVLHSELKEGQMIILGLGSSFPQMPQGGPRMMMMGGPPR